MFIFHVLIVFHWQHRSETKYESWTMTHSITMSHGSVAMELGISNLVISQKI